MHYRVETRERILLVDSEFDFATYVSYQALLGAHLKRMLIACPLLVINSAV